MRNDVKTAWVAALESGNYAQAQGRLKGMAKYADITGMCCLGVLACVLRDQFPELLKETGYQIVENDYSIMALTLPDNPFHRESITELPQSLWIKLEASRGQGQYTLMNDEKNKSFKEIAAFIREEE